MIKKAKNEVSPSRVENTLADVHGGHGDPNNHIHVNVYGKDKPGRGKPGRGWYDRRHRLPAGATPVFKTAYNKRRGLVDGVLF